MTDKIRIVFQTNIRLLELTDKAVYYFREQNYRMALEYMSEVSDKMRNVIDGIVSDREYFDVVSTDSLMEMLEGIVEAGNCGDYVLLADLLEIKLNPLLYKVQDLIMQKEDDAFYSEIMYRDQSEAMKRKLADSGRAVSAERLFAEPLRPEELVRQGYRVEFTSCGLMTLAVRGGRGSVYLHSNHKISTEAFLLAKSWKEEGKDVYLVKGFGLGYHVDELSKLCPEAKIEVYESDGQVLKLACAFSPLRKLLANDKISICYDIDGSMWKNRVEILNAGEKVCLHMPTVHAGSALF